MASSKFLYTTKFSVIGSKIRVILVGHQVVNDLQTKQKILKGFGNRYVHSSATTEGSGFLDVIL